LTAGDDTAADVVTLLDEDIIDLRSMSLIPDFSGAGDGPTHGLSDERQMPRGRQQQSGLYSRLHTTNARHSAYTQAVRDFTRNNVEATLSNAASRSILSTKPNVASTLLMV